MTTTATTELSTATNPVTLTQIAEHVQSNLKDTSLSNWVSEQDTRGQLVMLFRQYADGEHRANLTTEMRQLLRLGDTGILNRLNNNYMDIIIQTMVNRLQVTAIEADNKNATQWAEDLLRNNRFDAMQGDVHEAAIRDADTYVMSYFDITTKQTRFCHEPAYDGTNGVLALYESTTDTLPSVVIKIWRIGSVLRVNYYYSDHLERYTTTEDGSSLIEYASEEQDPVVPWTMNGKEGGEPLGIPITHFKNRSNGYSNYGRSELINAIPLQDAINRTLYSLIMTSELTGFPIRIARGFEPPAGITPGMWVTIAGKGMQKDAIADASTMEQGELTAYLASLGYYANEIGKITQTPSPEFGGNDNASGEALKQREIGLIGKVKRFQVKCGNAWEDMIVMAHRIQSAFGGGDAPPKYTRFDTRWADPEIRNDAVTIANAVSLVDHIGERAFLELIAPVFKWDKKKIDEVLAEKTKAKEGQLARIAGLGVNRYNNAQLPANTGNNQQVVNSAEQNGTNPTVQATAA